MTTQAANPPTFPSVRFVPFRDARLMACNWAEEACRVAGVTSAAVLEAVETSRAYAHGYADAADLKKARGAAWEDARTAAGYAAAYAAGGGNGRPVSVALVGTYAACAAAWATGTEDPGARDRANERQRQDMQEAVDTARR